MDRVLPKNLYTIFIHQPSKCRICRLKLSQMNVIVGAINSQIVCFFWKRQPRRMLLVMLALFARLLQLQVEIGEISSGENAKNPRRFQLLYNHSNCSCQEHHPHLSAFQSCQRIPSVERRHDRCPLRLTHSAPLVARETVCQQIMQETRGIFLTPPC